MNAAFYWFSWPAGDYQDRSQYIASTATSKDSGQTQPEKQYVLILISIVESTQEDGPEAVQSACANMAGIPSFPRGLMWLPDTKSSRDVTIANVHNATLPAAGSFHMAV